jgi:hypothetical protein
MLKTILNTEDLVFERVRNLHHDNDSGCVTTHIPSQRGVRVEHFAEYEANRIYALEWLANLVQTKGER